MKKGFFKSALSLALCVGMAFGIAACGENTEETEMKDNGLWVSEFTEPVALVDESVLTYMSLPSSDLVTNVVRSLGNEVRQDKGLPVTIEYGLDTDIVHANASTARVKISENKDLSAFRTVYFNEASTSVDVYNLKTGTKYYFEVRVQLTDGSTLTENGEFETVASPRFMNIEGTNNVRDIGGRTTESGKVIKQGLLYRGSEIDGGKNAGHPDFCLTEEGIATMRQVLKIQTDFDLRSESVKNSEHSILGEDVNRTFYDAPQYQNALTNKSKIAKIFSDLANPNAYPVYLHCTHGVDRAGTTSLLLEGLLGMTEEDLIRDYELSAFYYNYRHVNRNFENGGNVLNLLEQLNANYEGETLSEKIANFLLSAGVTQEEIDSIRSIFLD